jgi:hypothetical protein
LQLPALLSLRHQPADQATGEEFLLTFHPLEHAPDALVLAERGVEVLVCRNGDARVALDDGAKLGENVFDKMA